MARLGIRVPDKFHDQLKAAAALQGITVTDFVRRAVDNEVNNQHTSPDNVSTESQEILKGQVDSMAGQLDVKDQQIQELHQLVGIAQKNATQLSEQNQLLLEDTRQKRSFWSRFKSRSAIN